MDPVINKTERYIPVACPLLDGKEREYLQDCITRDWISQGPKVKEFEHQFSTAHRMKYGSACNSGTTALHLALAASNVGEGDEVIIPDMTMIAVANAVLMTGATPVFAPVAENNSVGNVSCNTIRPLITNRTKAIIVVHNYGEVVEDVKDIYSLCSMMDITVIEDCAESHFASLDDQMVGSFGDLSIFSFYSNKIITTGEGGMVLCRDEETKNRLDSIRMHAFTPGKHFCHSEHAFGYRMTDMQAAIGLAQLEDAHYFLDCRKDQAKFYRTNLNLKHFQLGKVYKNGDVDWVMPLIAPNQLHRDGIRKYLADNGIDTRTYFQLMSNQKFLNKYVRHISLPDKYWNVFLQNSGFYIPLYPKLTEDDLNLICELINKYEISNMR